MRKTVKQYGNGAHIILPLRWIGRTVEVKVVADFSKEENLKVLMNVYENTSSPKSVYDVQRKLMILLGRTTLMDEELNTCQDFFDSFTARNGD